MRRIFALVKPGGYFVSSTPCLGDSWVPFRPILAVMRWVGKAPPVEIMRARDLIEAIGDAGFVDITKPDVAADKHVAFVVAKRPVE